MTPSKLAATLFAVGFTGCAPTRAPRPASHPASADAPTLREPARPAIGLEVPGPAPGGEEDPHAHH